MYKKQTFGWTLAKGHFSPYRALQPPCPQRLHILVYLVTETLETVYKNTK